VLGNDDVEASVPGEIIPSREFYDYAAKYVDEDSRLLIPAPLTETQASEVRQLAMRAFQALDCSGLARVDLFLDKSTGAFLVNEINTMPGFTSISMYPKLWEATGLSYSALIDRLIALAVERHAEKKKLRTKY
jgi:D-alanine-D-alanine ligase